MMPAIYGNSYQIVQAPGYVVIRYEMIHEARVIPIGDSQHLPTTCAATWAMRAAAGRARPSSSRPPTSAMRSPIAARMAPLTFIERFTPIAPDKVRWAVTMDDPSTWVRPWTFAMPLTLDNSEPLFDYECHEALRDGQHPQRHPNARP